MYVIYIFRNITTTTTTIEAAMVVLQLRQWTSHRRADIMGKQNKRLLSSLLDHPRSKVLLLWLRHLCSVHSSRAGFNFNFVYLGTLLWFLYWSRVVITVGVRVQRGLTFSGTKKHPQPQLLLVTCLPTPILFHVPRGVIYCRIHLDELWRLQVLSTYVDNNGKHFWLRCSSLAVPKPTFNNGNTSYYESDFIGCQRQPSAKRNLSEDKNPQIYSHVSRVWKFTPEIFFKGFPQKYLKTFSTQWAWA